MRRRVPSWEFGTRKSGTHSRLTFKQLNASSDGLSKLLIAHDRQILPLDAPLPGTLNGKEKECE